MSPEPEPSNLDVVWRDGPLPRSYEHHCQHGRDLRSLLIFGDRGGPKKGFRGAMFRDSPIYSHTERQRPHSTKSVTS